MSQLKFYKVSVIALMILNIMLIAFFFLTKPKSGPPKHNNSGNFQQEVIKTLNLNESQSKEFQRLADNHFKMMKSINEEKSTLLKPFFENLTKDSTASNKEELLTKIEKLEGRKINYTYKHFEDLKATLDENQNKAFGEILEKFIDKLIISKRNNHPPHRLDKR